MITAIVIDDDQDCLEVFCEFLKIKGINVLGKGYNGKDAVELYKRYNPDIVLSDVMMPDYDGFYGLENIQNYDPDAKVIMVTASTEFDNDRKLMELGASHIIKKPFEIDKMLDIIQKIKIQN